MKPKFRPKSASSKKGVGFRRCPFPLHDQVLSVSQELIGMPIVAGARAGIILRIMRNAAGLTQAQLGELTQMQRSNISTLENSQGKQGPTFDVIARIAEACGFHLTFEAKSRSKDARESSAAPIRRGA